MSRPPIVSYSQAYGREDETEQFERHVVQKTLQTLGAYKLAGEVRRNTEDASGKNTLTLAAFHRVLPTFPCRLRVYNSKACRQLTLVRLLLTPLKQEATQQYYSMLDERREGRDEIACLIVRSVGFVDGLAFHNVDCPDRRAVILTVDQRPGERFFVEPYLNFLKHVTQGWRPERLDQ